MKHLFRFLLLSALCFAQIPKAGTTGVAGGVVGGASNLTTPGAIPYVSAPGTLNQDSPGLFWDAANDRLGLGTASPLELLHVKGSAKVGSFDGPAAALIFDAAAANAAALQFYSAGSAVGSILRPSSSTDIRVYSQALGADYVTFQNSTGNVGIGTTNPGYLLDVAKGTSATARFWDQTATTGNTNVVIRNGAAQTSNGATILLDFQNSSGSTIGNVADGGALIDFGSVMVRSGETYGSRGIAYLDSASGQDIIFRPGSTEKVRILNSGNVGIGTTGPVAALDVATSGASGTARFYDSRATVGDTKIVIRDGAGQSSNVIEFRTNADVLSGLISNSGTTTAQLYYFKTYNDNAGLLDGIGLTFGSGLQALWSSTASQGGTKDLGLARNAAGILEVNQGVAGRFANAKLSHIIAGSIATYAPAPVIASGFGTSPSIAGSDMAGRVTVGTGGIATTGAITFGTAWATAPSCTAQNETTTLLAKATATTTTLTIASATPFAASDVLNWQCIGY